MNDYQMRFLAEDRQRDLRTEADRARLARLAASRRSAASRPLAPRQRRPRLADLLTRVMAVGG